MVKRLFLFFAINCLVVLTISSILSIFNLNGSGLNYKSLFIFCGLWGMLGSIISLLLSRKTAKYLMNIQLINPSGNYAKLYTMVEQLSKDAGLSSVPEVGVFFAPEINAFATGPTKTRSLVAVSSGLLSQMDDNELKAILAHELSHITNGDMVTMTLIQGVVNAFVMYLSRITAFFISSFLRKGNRRSSYSQSSYSRPSNPEYYVLKFVFEIAFMILGSLLASSFSRYREFKADYGGATLTRKEFMISALEKIERITLNTKKPSSMNAFMISTPKKLGLLKLFATHPPISDRIARLKELP